MNEKELKAYWYPAYNDALNLLKNYEQVTEQYIAKAVLKYGNTVFNRLFCLAVWQEIKRLKRGNSSLNLQEYSKAIADVWMMFKEFSEVEDTEQYWDNLMGRIIQISQKYGQCRFILDLLIHVTLEEIERIWTQKEARKNGSNRC